MRINAPPAWAIHPFLRIAPPFLAGILLGETKVAGMTWAWYSAMASLCLLLVWSMFDPARRWALKSLTGPALFLLLAATGLICSLLFHTRHERRPAAVTAGSGDLVVALTELEGPENGHYKARASPLPSGASLRGAELGDVLLFIDTAEMLHVPEPGDLIAIRASCRPITNKGNPGEPDMRSIQAAKGLYAQAYLRAADMLLLEHRARPRGDAFFLASRTWIENTLHRYLKDDASADLASTLITGHRATMDPELLRAYANTGVVHVIAISGLHLGMIHGLLLWLLRPLFRKMGWSRVAGLVILPWLWAYAVFTGASASVIRSAAMFTGMGLAMAMGRKQFLLNGLCSSAMVLLACRPDWVSDIGFQLSYAALFSIAWFQPPLRRSLHFSNRMAVVVWDLVSVTLAAQVLTAPLVAWHFHRLPLLFLFSNLPVVPLSSLVLLLGILICLFAWLPAVAQPMGTFSTLLIHLMNGQVRGIDAVPNASLTDLRPDIIQVLLLYGMIMVVRMGNRKGWMIRGYLFWCLFAGYRLTGILHDRAMAQQRALIVFNVKRQRLYAIVEGRDMLVLADPVDPADEAARDRCVMQAVEYYRCRVPNLAALVPGRRMDWVTAGGSWKISCDTGETRLQESIKGLAWNIRSGTYRTSREQGDNRSLRAFLVADGSCSLWKIQQWKSSPEGVPSRFHSVAEQGAFVADMNPPSRTTP